MPATASTAPSNATETRRPVATVTTPGLQAGCGFAGLAAECLQSRCPRIRSRAMAALRRRALRAPLTLAVALAAGLAANCWAASDPVGAAEGAAVLPVAAPAAAPRGGGHETPQGRPIRLGGRNARA